MSEQSSDSEDCPSFATESESEHDSTWGEDKEQKEIDYTATAKDIICENVNITTENALKLNSGYHNMLKVLKNKLEILLVQCQERQQKIDQQIEEYRTAKRPLAGKARTSGYICGQPFFKDDDLYPGPHNEDYLYRKRVLKEFFPLDMFEATDTNWTVKDKVNILKGVKSQIVEFIERENRLKIKKIGNGLEAERLRQEIVGLKKKEIGELWEMVKGFPNEYPGQKFEIDWMHISNINISERHSVSACIGIWNNYMLPGLVRDAWKMEEESRLLEAVNKYNHQSWKRIAEEVPGRSAYQCFVHYQTTFSDLAQVKHDRWSAEEDALLVKVVDENRVGSNIIWNKVVEKMPLRNKVQCYNRYMFTLMRPMKHAKFTPEEDCIITAYVQEHGEDFRFIPPTMLPGRSSRQIWARYNLTLKYVNKHAGWTIEEDMRLMGFIKENLTDEGPRKISWAACAKVLGNHSRLSCRTRYYTIEKFLEKNPDATLDDVPRKEKRLSTTVTHENWVKRIVEIRTSDKDEQQQQQQPTEELFTSAGKQKPSSSTSTTKMPRGKRKPKPPRRFDEASRCAIKQKLYDKFKYSFHYQFGDQFVSNDNPRVCCTHKAICLLLDCSLQYDHQPEVTQNFTPAEDRFLRWCLSLRMNPLLVNFLKNCTTSFLLPPSYNTILGLRGVVLNATCPREINLKSEPKTERLDEPGFNDAMQKFRNRFRMIFYWTMLLARQNPREADFQSVGDGESATRPPEKFSTLQPFEHEHDYGRLYEQQASLEQLDRLYNASRRLPSPQPPPPQPSEPSTVCLQQLGLGQIAPTVVELPPTTTSSSSIIYLPLPDRLQPTQFCSPSVPKPLLPQPEVASYTYQTFDGSAVQQNQLDLVAQITIINPEDLPLVQMQPPPSVDQPMVVEAVAPSACDEVAIGGEAELEEHVESEGLSDNESVGDAGELDEAEEDIQQPVEEQEANHVDPATVEPAEPLEDEKPTEEPTENADGLEIENLTLSSPSLAHVTQVINVGDFVIEELEEAKETQSDSQTMSDVSSESDKKEDAEVDGSVVSQITPLNEPVESACEEKKEVESNWEPAFVRAPSRTYGRVRRSSPKRTESSEVAKVVESHAWRWTHLDEAKLDEIEEHQELWEVCDPNRRQFHVVEPVSSIEEKDSEVPEQKTNPVIIIDDEVIEIKEEPEEDGESVAPEDPEQVDESTIQQIIQTASNIVRISQAYQLPGTSFGVTEFQIPPPPPPPPSLPSTSTFFPMAPEQPESSSLIVQTPSRIFDEESNCYYFVDELTEEEAVANFFPFEQAQHSTSTFDNLVQRSLEQSYPMAMPQFKTPQRVPSPISFEPIQLTRTPNRTPSTYGRRTRNASTDSRSAPEPVDIRMLQPPAPTINKPKRPPRSEQPVYSPTDRKNLERKALSQLAEVYRQPRLRSLSSGSSSSSSKRLPRKQESPPVPKRIKVEQAPQVVASDEDDGLQSSSEEAFSAVDIIAAITSMNQRVKMEEDVTDEDDHQEGFDPDDEADFLAHLEQEERRSAARLDLEVKREVEAARPSTRPEVTKKPAGIQQMVSTIIESAAGKPLLDVQFKVAGLTISKVKQK